MPNQILLLCGSVSGPLLALTFLAQIIFQRNYHPIRQLASTLALHEYGWIQQINYIVTGSLIIACAFGFFHILNMGDFSIVGAACIGSFETGLVGGGFFIADNPEIKQRSPRGIAHDLFSLVALGGLFIGFFAFRQMFIAAGEYSWATYSMLSGILFGIGCALFIYGSDPDPIY